MQFVQSDATYLFDLASVAGAAQEDRTVAAWTVTPPIAGKRDISYQRGFPLPPDPCGALVDRGHLIPHLSGGEFGPNIFRQHRALNRGWSPEGKRFRALEREAAATPGTFYSATCSTKTTLHTPPRSRQDYSAERRYTLSGSVTGSRPEVVDPADIPGLLRPEPADVLARRHGQLEALGGGRPAGHEGPEDACQRWRHGRW